MPRRVLHLRTISGEGGGPEKTLLNSPKWIGPGYEIRLLYIYPQNDPHYNMRKRAQTEGVDFVDIGEGSGWDIRTISKLMKEIRQYKPNLLHAHDYKTNILGVYAAKRLGIPIVTTAHGYVTKSARLGAYYWLDRFALRRMDAVIAVSEDLRDHLRTLKVRNVSLVRNGIDIDSYRSNLSKSAARKRFAIPENRRCIVAIGRLQPEKGFDLLIRSLPAVLNSIPDAELIIAGTGPEHERLLAVGREVNCSERVRLLGYSDDIPALLRASDVFVLSSRREGLPNVVLEAMASEIPVVSTPIKGLENLAGSGCLRVVDLTPESLAVGVTNVLEEDSHAQHMVAIANKTLRQDYSFASRMKNIRCVYDNLFEAQP